MFTILHTADLHLGQKLYGWGREAEHKHTLQQIATLIEQHQVDVLLIAGDLFDTVNPSAESDSIYYEFLAQLHRQHPALQVVITAGNHDSASRLGAPSPLLRALHTSIINEIPYENHQPQYRQLVIPLGDAEQPQAYCVAFPYLRMQDLPTASNAAESYRLFFGEVFESLQLPPSIPIIMMAHMYVSELNDARNEQIVRGTLEAVPPSVFPSCCSYVALGHIHRAMSLGEGGKVRFSGSPLPLSFSEQRYQHGVTLLRQEKAGDSFSIEHIPLHPLAPLHQMKGTEEEILAQLDLLPSGEVDAAAPYLRIILKSDEPRPDLLYTFKQRAAGKYIRLCNIQRERITPLTSVQSTAENADKDLKEFTPMEVARLIYAENNEGDSLPNELESLLNSVLEGIQL